MNILFQASWCDYEEGYQITIIEEDGQLYKLSNGHNVMIGDYDSKTEISQEEAWEIMQDHIKLEDDEYLWS
jgi:hypothetical protein